MEIPHDDKLVFEQLLESVQHPEAPQDKATTDLTKQVTRIAPQPEEPVKNIPSDR
jgi:hypothetical protein